MTDLSEQLLFILDEHKAQDVLRLDIRSLTDMADEMIIVTATSNRHGYALADKLCEWSKAPGNRPLSVEGLDTGEWILIDFVDVIVHIFLKDVRELYQREKLWSSSGLS